MLDIHQLSQPIIRMFFSRYSMRQVVFLKLPIYSLSLKKNLYKICVAFLQNHQGNERPLPKKLTFHNNPNKKSHKTHKSQVNNPIIKHLFGFVIGIFYCHLLSTLSFFGTFVPTSIQTSVGFKSYNSFYTFSYI